MPKGGLKNSKLVDKKFKNRFTFLIWRLLSKINARNGVFSIQNERNPPNLNYIWTKQIIKKFRSLFLYTTFIVLLFSLKLGGLLSLFWFIIKNIFIFDLENFARPKTTCFYLKKLLKSHQFYIKIRLILQILFDRTGRTKSLGTETNARNYHINIIVLRCRGETVYSQKNVQLFGTRNKTNLFTPLIWRVLSYYTFSDTRMIPLCNKIHYYSI